MEDNLQAIFHQKLDALQTLITHYDEEQRNSHNTTLLQSIDFLVSFSSAVN